MKRVLVIEDEISVLENLIEILGISDYEVYSASDGIQGVEFAKRYLPDLIICDILMPIIDGYEVLEALRNDEQTSAIPFIFLTAKSDKTDIRYGMELGADDYLTKPFTAEQLFSAIETRLDKYEKIYQASSKSFNELKLNLASMLPHEFRTPLNGIIATTQLLMKQGESYNSEELNIFYTNIYKSSQRLYRLALNYLLYSELTILASDSIKTEQYRKSKTTNTYEILFEVFAKSAADYSRSKDLITGSSSHQIMVMPEHFYKICEELADNAFKFSSNETSVIVQSDIKDGYYCLSVIDYGRGMDNRQINKIDSFVQFNRSIYEQQGSGLGLAIVQNIVKLYNGKLKIFSQYGKSTEVSVFLPQLSL
ncbi:MAG: hypothetical protein QG635_1655 [Bacteroidota bacterium]|nr:hypothetical protein [Bacteroidota bacterium]